MKHMLLILFAGFLGLTLVAVDADARRFGGGRSMGRSAPASPPPRAAPQQQRAQQPGAAPTRPSGASRWLGPLAGLAAGGLLAFLFFGDAFDGFQFMDFLLIALLVFGGFMLFRALRARSSAAPMQRQGPVPAGPMSGGTPRPRGGRPNFEVPEIGSGRGSMGSAGAPPQALRPNWFNEEQFLRAAKSHFINLQAAWDSGDMGKIREYTAPELFAELDAERQSYGGQQQYTEVVSLDTELLGLQNEDRQVVASVRYSGMIREGREAPAHPFNEIWHIQRALDDPKANWYIAGIEQQGSAT